MFAFVYLVAINLARYISLLGSGDHTLFEVGYALPPCLMWGMAKLRLPTPYRAVGGFLLLLAAIAGDVAAIVSRRFGWDRGALFEFAGSARDWPWGSIWPAALAVSAAAALASVLLYRRSLRPFRLWPLLALLAGLAVGDFLAGENRFSDTTSGTNILSMSGVTVFNGLIKQGPGTLKRLADGTMASDLAVAGGRPRQILSVSVESLGRMQHPEERLALIEPLLVAVGERYRLTQVGVHRFYGATLAGETRELCGLRLAGALKGGRLYSDLRRSCLPARLAASGYETDALHGNGSGIYDRNTVYRAMGFQRTWFNDELQRDDTKARGCSSALFVAVCDERTFRRALALFNGRARFVHVMTIDTHLPIGAAYGEACPARIDAPKQVCRYMRTMRHTFAALGDAIRAAQSPPDRIVIYGDHAPPFFAESARSRFTPGIVPYLVLNRSSAPALAAAKH